MVSPILGIALTLVLLICSRIYSILPKSVSSKTKRSSSSTCSFAIFLGSGGHTSEALSLVSALDFNRYTPRMYIVSEGDTLSAQKAVALEVSKGISDSQSAPAYTILTIPRARRVHQSLTKTPPTALYSLLACIYQVSVKPVLCPPPGQLTSALFADVLLLNGPGTCFMLCIALYFNKFIGLPSPKLLYIESFARVQSLSLSGKLLRPFVDRFIVQWPDSLEGKDKGECHGWLV